MEGLEPSGYLLLRQARIPIPPHPYGSEGRSRTCNLAVNGRLLYQLSYPGTFGGAGMDSNPHCLSA